MKILSTLLAVLLCVALTVAGVSLGVRSGWLAEREEALSLTGDLTAMAALIDERAMDAANLAVVAARHLPADDKQLLVLQDAQQTLAQAKADAQALASADNRIRDIAADFALNLPLLASVQASARDQVYISMLTRSLTEGETAQALLYEVAQGFNTRLDASFTGWLAKLTGVEPITTE